MNSFFSTFFAMKRELLPKTAALALAAATLLIATTACSSQSRLESHMAKAEEHFANGDFRAAEIEYKNALQIDSTVAEASGQLGLIYFEQGRQRLAMPLLSQATQIDPENAKFLGPLLSIQSQIEPPEDVWKAAKDLLAKDPADRYALSALQSSALRLGRADEARSMLENLASQGNSAAATTALAMLDASSGNLDSAMSSLERAIQIDPSYSLAHLGKGNLLWAKQDLEAADKSFSAASASAAGKPNLILAHAQFKLQTGNQQDARVMLERVEADYPDFVPGLVARARLYAVEGSTDDALKLMKRAEQLDPISPEIAMLASQLDLRMGDAASAVSRMKIVTQRFPNFADGHYFLSQALIADDQPLQASSSLLKTLSLQSDHVGAILALSNLEIDQGDFGSAEARLLRAVEIAPDNHQASFLLARGYALEKSFSKALELYLSLAEKIPNDPAMPYQAALLQMELGDSESARKSFETSLERNPAFVPALEQVLLLEASEKKFDLANARLAPLIEKEPDSAILQFLSGKLALAENDSKAGIYRLKRALSLDPTLRPASYALAQTYLAVGELAEAQAILDRLIAANPEDVEAIFSLGNLHEQSSAYTTAMENYNTVLKIDSNHYRALNNLAYLLSDKSGNIEDAYTMALRARELAPNDPAIADTLGWIAYLKGDFSFARDLLEESSKKLADPSVAYHLGKAYEALEMNTEAKNAFEKALSLGLSGDEESDAKNAIGAL
jgi:tetratricopeptide (TPR) repeat protein